MTNTLVFGVGINDLSGINGYKTEIREELPKINNKRQSNVIWKCPVYQKWQDMLKRCYSVVYHSKDPSYIGCTVCDDWVYLSKFKRWMDLQEYSNKELDKDLLIADNKLYSPSTCLFIPRMLNAFIVSGRKSRGKYKIGASWHKAAKKFLAECHDPLKRYPKYIGLFETEKEAHNAWLTTKLIYAEDLIIHLKLSESCANSLRALIPKLK